MNPFRGILIVTIFCLSLFDTIGQTRHAVVADDATRAPLPSASVFDCKGRAIGVCNSRGHTPYIPESSYPITIRYLGYNEKVVKDATTDTIFLHESHIELPEVVIESRNHKVLHILSYLREYSLLTNYTDTVFLFREKMVDYMLPADSKSSFKGWAKPRILKAKSYYRFTNAYGLDSVSDKGTYHFSWSDWITPCMTIKMPSQLITYKNATDTVYGKYSPAEIWKRSGDCVNIAVNVLADTVSRRWVSNLSSFFRKNLDFENVNLHFKYDNVIDDNVSPMNLTGYTFNIESNGRGHDMFMFNNLDQSFFVSTYAEAYIIDREYITVKEAKKWERHNFNDDEFDIFVPVEAPELQPSILQLVARVNSIDNDRVRVDRLPDPKIGHCLVVNNNFRFGNRVLMMLKDMVGISSYKFHRNTKNTWNDIKNRQLKKNLKKNP